MRKISLGEENGIKKMFLNNKFVFQMGPLDQGFWPDGLYTAPIDEALRYDIEMTKKLGFNMTRKHIKVEPARWYYWTDKLGLFVWQDMPSANSYYGDNHIKPEIDKVEYSKQLQEMVETHSNIPSIVSWIVFNETQAVVCGEYGGIGYLLKGHACNGDGWGYTSVVTPRDLEFMYAEFMALNNQYRKDGMSGAVYTQITNVEGEINGLMSYDRILKVDAAQIALANRFKYPVPTYTAIV